MHGEGESRIRVSAISAAFLGPIHQALSFAFLASAFAEALLGSGFGGVTTLAIAGAGGVAGYGTLHKESFYYRHWTNFDSNVKLE